MQKQGLPGDHHFYVTFDTKAPGTILSKRLKEQYPDEMTIVLQHRFWDLMVYEDRFEVKLSFNTVPERLIVPFSAINGFVDPSVSFGFNPNVFAGAVARSVQVQRPTDAETEQDKSPEPGALPRPASRGAPTIEAEPDPDIEIEVEEVPAPQSAEVVKLDLFRKK